MNLQRDLHVASLRSSALIHRAIRVAKWLWIFLVLGLAIYYVVRRFGTIEAQVKTIGWWRLSVAMGLLIFSKLLVIQLAREAVRLAQHPIPFAQMFYFDSLSQLAKYLPGGVWHFVSRGGFYRAEGLELRQITQALIIENVWLLSGACVVGAWAVATFHLSLSVVLLLTLALMFAWGAGLWLMFGGLVRQPTTPASRRPNRTIVWNQALQTSIWIIRGISLWMIVPEAHQLKQSALVTGAFCLGWALGYIAVFAPGGVGIRESAILFLLTPILSPADSLVYVALHRFLWMSTEVLLGLAALGLAISHGKWVGSSFPEELPQHGKISIYKRIRKRFQNALTPHH